MRQIEFQQTMHAIVFDDEPYYAECLENGIGGCGDTLEEAIAQMQSLCNLTNNIDRAQRLEKFHECGEMDKGEEMEDTSLHSVLQREAEAEEATCDPRSGFPPR